ATTPDEFGVPVVNFEKTTRGSSAKASIFGGDGNDEFNVNHNEAELFLFGEDGDDVFAVFTFLALTDASSTDPVNLPTLDDGTGFETIVRGGSGNDHIHIGGEPPVLVFDPPPSIVQPAPIRQVSYDTEFTPVLIDAPAFTRTVPLADLSNLQAYAAQYRDPGGNAGVSVQSINFAPITINFFFFSW